MKDYLLVVGHRGTDTLTETWVEDLDAALDLIVKAVRDNELDYLNLWHITYSRHFTYTNPRRPPE